MNTIREDIEELWPELEAGVRYLARKSDENTGRGKEDGVSTTTGATEEQANDVLRYLVGYLTAQTGMGIPVIKHVASRVTEILVPPGMVIASAADVATVPTAEEIAAIRDALHVLSEVASFAGKGDEWSAEFIQELRDVDVYITSVATTLRAYLDRVTG